MLGKLFDNRNPFWQFMAKLFDVAVLNLLWVVTSIPLVTAPASTAAVFSVCFTMLREQNDEGVFRIFLRSWRENFRQSLVLGVVWLVAVALFGFDLWYFSLAQQYLTGAVKLLVCAFVTLLLYVSLSSGVWAFALQSLFENTVKETLKNALVLSLRHPLRSFLSVAAGAGMAAGGVLSLIYLPTVSIVFIIFGVGLHMFLSCLFLLPVLKKYIGDDAEETEPEIFD